MAKRAALQPTHPLFRRTGPLSVEGQDESAPVKSPTRQSAIFLEERHIDWLEDRCREARRGGGRAVRKAAIIRALLDVAMESPVNLHGLLDEGDLTARVRKGLKASARG
ncbi:MAG: hypothetical protein HYX88_02210 [Chloroflexi bacterium]|nr:hypothetical protein [Chloroflexota bacterium]